MKKLLNIIKWTEGKKTYFGIALHVGLAAFTIFTGKISLTESIEYHAYISSITGVGLFHKAQRKWKIKKTNHIQSQT